MVKYLADQTVDVTEFLIAVRNLDVATAETKKSRLSREQERLICGYVAYVIVWLLLLQLLIHYSFTTHSTAHSLLLQLLSQLP